MALVRYFVSAVAVTAALAFFASKGVTAPSESAPVAAGAGPHAQPAVAFPTTGDGLPVMQLGMGSGVADPFINVIKYEDSSWSAPEAAALGAENFTADWMPKAVPPRAPYIESASFRSGAHSSPALLPYYAGTWVVEWDGDANAAFALVWANEVTTKRVGSNRIEGAFPAKMNGARRSKVRFTRIGEGGVSNLKVYRKEHEALLKAGGLLAPDFAAYCARYKVLRTLDLQAVNINWQRTADQFAPLDAPGWRPANFEKQKTGPRGFPPEPMFQMAMECGSALWMHFPGQAGAGPEFDADDIFKNADDGTTGDVKGALHSLSRAKAKEIIASPEWDRIAARIADALIASGYPEDRRFYLELSNEVWNFGSPFWRTTHYFQGIGMAVAPEPMKGERFRIGYGYAAARMAEAFEKALADRGRRQAWVPVIAGQMANARRTELALEGYKMYFEERGADPAPWLKIAGVATASYYQGALHMKKGIVTPGLGESPPDAWLREIRADPDGLAKRAADRIIDGPASTQGTLAWIVNRRDQQEKTAKAFGAFLLGDYEGHDHDGGNPPAALRNEPDYVNWVERYRYGPEGERVTRAWVEALRKQNPEAVIANFYGVSPGDQEPDETDTVLESPWADGFYGEDNGRTRAFGEYLRKPK